MASILKSGYQKHVIDSIAQLLVMGKLLKTDGIPEESDPWNEDIVALRIENDSFHVLGKHEIDKHRKVHHLRIPEFGGVNLFHLFLA